MPTQFSDFVASVEPDLTELVTTLKIEPRRPRRPRRKYFLWASWLSFLPDHALDSILDARDLPVNEEADGTSAQLLPFSSLYRTARPLNELTYFFFAVFEKVFAVRNAKPNQPIRSIGVILLLAPFSVH